MSGGMFLHGQTAVNSKILNIERRESKMTTYRNTGGNSGVSAYECGSDYIKVRFLTGDVYHYTYQSAGRSNIEHMKVLAENGSGLNAFINTTARSLYVK